MRWINSTAAALGAAVLLSFIPPVSAGQGTGPSVQAETPSNGPPLREGSGDPAALLVEARLAAGRDDHDAAIKAYRKIVEADPSLRDSVSLALASQLTWIGSYEAAIAEFGWYLERHPSRVDGWLTLGLAQSWGGRNRDAVGSYRRALALDPQNQAARFGEARTLSWMGRSQASLHAYQGLIQEHPDFTDGRLGLAQLHNWRGDHRKAWKMYRAICDGNPVPPAAWEGLAQAQNWAGRPDLALATLREGAKSATVAAGGRGLEQEIHRQWPWRILSGVDLSKDSDDFTSRGLRVEAEAPLGQRAHARLGTLQNRFDKPGVSPQEDLWLLASADWRIATPWTATAAAQVVVDRPDSAGYTPLQLDLGAGWIPGDRLRVDLSYSRLALFTFESLPDRLTGDLFGMGVTWRPQYLTSILLSGDRATYSDQNQRINLRGRVRHWALARPARVWLEAGTQFLDFHRRTPGIWSPEQYHAYYGRADLEFDPVSGLTLLAGCDGGWARESATILTPYFSYSGGVVWSGHGLRAEVRAGHADANVETGRGYRRSFGSFGLGFSW